jgi:hypothetical protein
MFTWRRPVRRRTREMLRKLHTAYVENAYGRSRERMTPINQDVDSERS